MVNLSSEEAIFVNKLKKLFESGVLSRSQVEEMVLNRVYSLENFIVEDSVEEFVYQGYSNSVDAGSLSVIEAEDVIQKPVSMRFRSYRYKGKDGYIEFAGLSKIFARIRKNGQNLRPLLVTIGKHFFKTNKKAIFSQRGPTEAPFFVPYSPATVSRKKNIYGGAYPMLVYSGDLMRSLINYKDSNAVMKPTNTSLLVGTKIEYAKMHQDGVQQVNLPARPPVQVNPRGTDRYNIWLKMARDYATKLS